MKISRRWKIVGVILVLFIVALLVATYYFENIVKQIVVTRLGERGLQAKIGDLSLGLLRGTCSVSDFSLSSKEGQPLLTAEYAGVNANAWEAISGSINIQSADLRGAAVQAQIAPDGKLNWLTLLTTTTTPAGKPAEPPAAGKTSFQIGTIQLKDVKLSIQDTRAKTPVKSVELQIGAFSANLTSGHLSASAVQLQTPGSPPYLRLDSLDVKGNLTYPFKPPLALESVEVGGVEGRISLNEQGKPDLQVWLEEIARSNGLMQDEKPTPAEASSSAEVQLPRNLSVNKVQLELAYPSGTGETWTENIALDRFAVDGGKGNVELSGLEWKNNRKQLPQSPVLKIGLVQLAGDLNGKPRRLDSVQVKTLDASLVKPSKTSFDVVQRLNRLASLLQGPQPSGQEAALPAQEPALQLTGTVALTDIRCRVLVEDNAGKMIDNAIQLGSAELDFKKGDLKVAQLRLSDASGSLQNSAVDVGSIAGQGNWAFPPPESWNIQQLVVEKPVLHLVRSANGEIDLLKRVDQLSGQEGQKTGTAEKPSSFKLLLKRLEIRNMILTLLDRLPTGEEVKYDLQPAELVVTDFAYPGGGQDWTQVQFKTAITAPTPGGMDLQARIHQQNPPNNFDGKLQLTLADITRLRAYYADKLPVEIQSGGLSFVAEGKCTDRRLDVPFTLRVVSPQLAPREKAGLNVFRGLSNAGTETLVNSLKDKQGDLVHQGKITGTLDAPQFVNPWAEMGKLLTTQLTKNLANLPELAGQLGGTAKEAVGTAGDAVKKGVGTVGETIKGILPRKK